MTVAERALIQIHTLIEDNDKTAMGHYEDVPQTSINRTPKSNHDLLKDIKVICEKIVGTSVPTSS